MLIRKREIKYVYTYINSSFKILADILGKKEKKNTPSLPPPKIFFFLYLKKLLTF